ncbi:MAG: TetR/AcrR family transcriptional regulator [Alphaproteobacteria bacterium]|nr:TetR/AcrR family transcriptional regulator [Alphaproteobacteria bacterium]
MIDSAEVIICVLVMTATQKTKEQLVLDALALAGEQDWGALTLEGIADYAGVTLADLYAHFDSKADILAALAQMIDDRALPEGRGVAEGSSPREELFDILMDRFEVLSEYRAGLISILNSFRCDPRQALIGLPQVAHSMRRVLEAAGIETDGWQGAIRVAGLSGIYLKVLHVWMEDGSPDLSKTMAALDKDLGRAESFINALGI